MRVTLTKHEFTPGRRLYVAKPTGTVQSGPICIWLCGGGLARTNAIFLRLVLPRLARQGHIVVGPRYATSSPPLLYAIRTVLFCALTGLLLRFVPGSWPGIPGLLLVFAAVALLSALHLACKPSVQHPDHVRDAARAVAN